MLLHWVALYEKSIIDSLTFVRVFVSGDESSADDRRQMSESGSSAPEARLLLQTVRGHRPAQEGETGWTSKPLFANWIQILTSPLAPKG
jgi:hypothetical protein